MLSCLSPATLNRFSQHPARVRAPLPLPRMLFFDTTNLYIIFIRWKRSLAKNNPKQKNDMSFRLSIYSLRRKKAVLRLIVSERFFLFNVLSWLHFNPFSAPYFKGGILLKRFGFLQILTCSISFLWRDQATSGAQEKLRTERGPCKNLSLSRHSTVNDVIKSAKCVGLGPRTTNTFYMSV